MDVIRDEIVLPTLPLAVLGILGGSIAGLRQRDRMRAAGTIERRGAGTGSGSGSGAGVGAGGVNAGSVTGVRKGAARMARAAGAGAGGAGVVMYALATTVNVTILSFAFFGCRTGLVYGMSRLKDMETDKKKDKEKEKDKKIGNNVGTYTSKYEDTIEEEDKGTRTDVPRRHTRTRTAAREDRERLVASAAAGFGTGTLFDTIRRGRGRGALVVGVTYGTLACVTDYGVQSVLAYRAHRISMRRLRNQDTREGGEGGGAGAGGAGDMDVSARRIEATQRQLESGAAEQSDERGGEGVWERVKRFRPFRVIPDDEYRAIMVDRIRDLDAQITLVNDEIRCTKRDIQGTAARQSDGVEDRTA